MDWDNYQGPFIQYPAKTNSYETKFEADRAMAARMSASPMPTLLTPQLGCAQWPTPTVTTRKKEGFSSDPAEQVGAIVESVGGWFNLFVLIFLAIIIAYQIKVLRTIQEIVKHPAQ